MLAAFISSSQASLKFMVNVFWVLLLLEGGKCISEWYNNWVVIHSFIAADTEHSLDRLGPNHLL